MIVAGRLAREITQTADANGGRFPLSWPVSLADLWEATREIRAHRKACGLPVYASTDGMMFTIDEDGPDVPLNGLMLMGVPLVLSP